MIRESSIKESFVTPALYLKEEVFQKHVDQIDLNLFTEHLKALYQSRLLLRDKIIPEKNSNWRCYIWHYNMLCMNLYLHQLESQHSGYWELIRGLQFFVVKLMTYHNVPQEQDVIDVFTRCLTVIEKENKSEVKLTDKLSGTQSEFLNYLVNVHKLEKQLDKIMQQEDKVRTIDISESQRILCRLQAQRSEIMKWLYHPTFVQNPLHSSSSASSSISSMTASSLIKKSDNVLLSSNQYVLRASEPENVSVAELRLAEIDTAFFL
jgi:hypothetical protein